MATVRLPVNLIRAAPKLTMLVCLTVALLATAGSHERTANAQQLRAIDATKQFYIRIDGARRGDSLAGVAGVGDMNQDGRPDLIVGSSLADTGGHKNNGGAWVVFTPRKSSVIDLAHLGRHGFRIQGRPPVFRRGPGGDLQLTRRDCVGGSVSGAGDVNRDGRPDVIVGNSCYEAGAGIGGRTHGAAYVIFGKRSTSTVDLAHLGRRGFRISAHGKGKPQYQVASVAGVGDMNGDRRGDVIVGAQPPLTLDGVRYGRGGAFVVFGKRSHTPVDLTHLGPRGFRVRGGIPTDETGASVAAAGDVNGDGTPDVMVGAPNFWIDFTRMTAGAAYVVFGKSSTATIDLDRPRQGYPILAPAYNRRIGRTVAGVGDVNGDGRADLVLGASGADYDGQRVAGSAYVVFGQASGPVDLASLGAGGFRIDGPAGTSFSTSVARAGDVNGDGRADVMVVAPFFEFDRPLATYVVFGKASPEPVDLAAIDAGTGGFRIDGRVVGQSAIPDLNGDRRSDLLLSAGAASNNGRRQSGSVYVVLSP